MLIQKDRFWKEGDGNYEERHLYVKYSNKEKKWKEDKEREERKYNWGADENGKECKREIEIVYAEHGRDRRGREWNAPWEGRNYSGGDGGGGRGGYGGGYGAGYSGDHGGRGGGGRGRRN